jgi:hypothetical protein
MACQCTAPTPFIHELPSSPPLDPTLDLHLPVALAQCNCWLCWLLWPTWCVIGLHQQAAVYSMLRFSIWFTYWGDVSACWWHPYVDRGLPSGLWPWPTTWCHTFPSGLWPWPTTSGQVLSGFLSLFFSFIMTCCMWKEDGWLFNPCCNISGDMDANKEWIHLSSLLVFCRS